MLFVPSLYITLFLTSFASATFFPMISDPLAIFMQIHSYNVFAVVLVATAGSFIGSCTTYLLGFYGREKIIEKHMKVNEKSMDEYKKRFEKYGAPALLFAWIPFLGDAIVAVSGILQINFIEFSAYAILGKLIRFSIIAYAVSFYN